MNDETAILRQHAKDIFQAGVAAANPYHCVKQYLNCGGDFSRLVNQQATEVILTKIHLIAFGKAACAMSKAAVDVLNPPQSPFVKGGRNNPPLWKRGTEGDFNLGIAVTNYDNVTAVDNIEVIGAGHPLPDLAGFHAAQKVAHSVSAAQAGELVLVLISGGGSALLPYPVDTITLQDKIATTDLLLASGSSINEINCVRKHLSTLKGGGLAQLAAPAAVHALILSDVIGDDLSAIASGATVADDSTYADALTVLQNRNILHSVPASVRQHLQDGMAGKHAETPKTGNPIFATVQNTLIGSNALSVQASLTAAQNNNYNAQIYSNALCGNARDEANKLARYAKQLQNQGIANPLALIAGGETTVQLKGTGQGGRNQEFALAFALAAQHYELNGNWVLLSGGTDGRDGPTDAAGGIVDPNSLQRMTGAGIEPAALLDNNDSYHALAASDDLLVTGATGTNVADLQILLLHP